MTWNFDNDRPIYLQVMEQLKHGIISGELPAGSRMVAVRELASAASVNPNTMQKALSELEREGLLYTQRTNGRFVTEDSDKIIQLRLELVRTRLMDFVGNMERLGYTRRQLLEMLEKVLEEDTLDGQ